MKSALCFLKLLKITYNIICEIIYNIYVNLYNEYLRLIMAQKSLSKGKRLNLLPLNKLEPIYLGKLDIKGEKVFSKPVRTVIE